MNAAAKERWLRPDEACLIVGVKRKTLANWRSLGRGPEFSKDGRIVLYRLSDLVDFREATAIPVTN